MQSLQIHKQQQPQRPQSPQQQSLPPSFPMPRNRLIIETRHLSSNQQTGPLTPTPVPARQSANFSMINTIVNDSNYSLRNTMPAQIQNLAIDPRRIQRPQTNQIVDENNQMSPYPNKQNLAIN